MKILFGLALVCVSACNESKEVGPETIGYDFYPINVGESRVYNMFEIQYLVKGFDTSTYQLRETIFDSIPSNDQVTYLLKREIRSNENDKWENDSTWSVTRQVNYLSITENNIPFIKLTFPVKDKVSWDGNSLNSRNQSTYSYQAVDSAVIDSLKPKDHIRVIIENIEENVTGLDLRSETYAKGIGLVSKDYFTQSKCTASSCGEDLGKVIAGRLLRQTLIKIEK